MYCGHRCDAVKRSRCGRLWPTSTDVAHWIMGYSTQVRVVSRAVADHIPQGLDHSYWATDLTPFQISKVLNKRRRCVFFCQKDQGMIPWFWNRSGNHPFGPQIICDPLQPELSVLHWNFFLAYCILCATFWQNQCTLVGQYVFFFFKWTRTHHNLFFFGSLTSCLVCLINYKSLRSDAGNRKSVKSVHFYGEKLSVFCASSLILASHCLAVWIFSSALTGDAQAVLFIWHSECEVNQKWVRII